MGMGMQLLQIEQNVLDEIKNNPECLFKIDVKDEKYNMVDIDKSWGALEYIIYHNLINETIYDSMNTTQIIDIEKITPDVSINYLNMEQVNKLSQALSTLDKYSFVQFFDIDKMNAEKIYGFPFDNSEGCYAYFLHHLERLKNFYHTASKNNNGVLLYIF